MPIFQSPPAFASQVPGGLPVADQGIDIQTTPPGAPNNGDRYIVEPAGTGDWAGRDNDIAQWNGATASWEFETPTSGTLMYLTVPAETYIFLAGVWQVFDVTVEMPFTQLTDTPASYAGAAGQYVCVNGTETGLEFNTINTDLDVGTTQIQNGTANGILYQDAGTTLQNGSAFTFDGSQVSVSDVPNQVALMSGNQGFEHLIGAGPDSVVNVNANSIDLFDNLQNGLQASVQAGFFGTTDFTGRGTAQLQSIDGGISVAGVGNNGGGPHPGGTYVRFHHDPSRLDQRSMAIEWFDFNGNNFFWYNDDVQIIDATGAGHSIQLTGNTPLIQLTRSGSQVGTIEPQKIQLYSSNLLEYLELDGEVMRLSGSNTAGHISHLQGWGGTSDPRTWTLPDNSGTIALTSDIPAGGLTIGDAITGGTSFRVLFEDGSNQLAQSGEFRVNGSATQLQIGTPSTVPTTGVRIEQNNARVGSLNADQWLISRGASDNIQAFVGAGINKFLGKKSGSDWELDFAAITTNRNWAMPDQSGTVALTSDITTSFPLQAPNGSLAAPSYSFSSSTSTGMHWDTVDLNFGVSGRSWMRLGGSGVTLGQTTVAGATTVNVDSPAGSDSTIQLRANVAAQIGIIRQVSGGNLELTSGGSFVVFNDQPAAPDSGYTFANDFSTGISRAAGQLNLSMGGGSQVSIQGTRVLFDSGVAVEIDGALDHDGSTAGFFGTAPASQPATITQTFATASATHAARTAVTLTDNSGGTANTTIAAITNAANAGSADVGPTADAIADLAAQVNNLQTDQVNTASVVNDVIDKLQSLGLIA